MNALPRGTNFRSLRRVRVLLALATVVPPVKRSFSPRPILLDHRAQLDAAGNYLTYYFFITLRLPATVRRPARLVLAFVLVLCPWTGKPRRCRVPR
jgi:hypothetical protein